MENSAETLDTPEMKKTSPCCDAPLNATLDGNLIWCSKCNKGFSPDTSDRRDSIWDKLDDWTSFYKLRRKMKFVWQRVTRGWSDEDTWSLDYTFCKWMLPRLKRFKKIANGYPDHMKPEEWDATIDKMIYSMEVVLYDEDAGWLHIRGLCDEDHEKSAEKWKRVDEGFELLGKHIRNLWW